MGVIMQVPTK